MAHDAYSGDYGLGFFGISLEASSYLVIDSQLGPLCYLCDLVNPDDEHDDGTYTLAPRDAYRQRVYLEPLGLFLQADSGTIRTVGLNQARRQILVTFEAADATPAKFQSYDVLRLRVDKVSLPAAARPGSNFTISGAGGALARGAFEIPAHPGATQVTIVYNV